MTRRAWSRVFDKCQHPLPSSLHVQENSSGQTQAGSAALSPGCSEGLASTYRLPWSARLGPLAWEAPALTLEPRRKGRPHRPLSGRRAPPHARACGLLSRSPPPLPPCGEPHPFHASQSLQTTSSIMFSLINF